MASDPNGGWFAKIIVAPAQAYAWVKNLFTGKKK